MGRYSKEHKEKSKQKILEAAGLLFRKDGYAATGVDSIMAKAGMTAGAFYHHFKSKEHLFEECLNTVFSHHRELFLNGLREKNGNEFLEGIVKRYLSRIHRDQQELGCTVPALGAEISRCANDTKAAFEREFLITKKEVEARLPNESWIDSSDYALAVLALCAGATVLARSVNDIKLSDQLLASGKKFLLTKQKH